MKRKTGLHISIGDTQDEPRSHRKGVYIDGHEMWSKRERDI